MRKNRFNRYKIKGLIVGLFILSALVVKAGGEVGILTGKDKSKAEISISNFDATVIYLSIEDEDGSTEFYSIRVDNSEDFSKIFNFSRLDDGNYSLIVKAGNEVIKKPFSIQNSEISLKEYETIKEPFFKMKESSILVYFNKPSNDGAFVNFSDKNGSFFDDEVSAGTNTRKYSVSGLKKGDYKMTVSIDDHSTTYEFNIE